MNRYLFALPTLVRTVWACCKRSEIKTPVTQFSTRDEDATSHRSAASRQWTTRLHDSTWIIESWIAFTFVFLPVDWFGPLIRKGPASRCCKLLGSYTIMVEYLSHLFYTVVTSKYPEKFFTYGLCLCCVPTGCIRVGNTRLSALEIIILSAWWDLLWNYPYFLTIRH